MAEAEEQPAPADEAAPPAAAVEEQPNAGDDADMTDAAAAQPEEAPEAAEAAPAGGTLRQLQAGWFLGVNCRVLFIVAGSADWG